MDLRIVRWTSIAAASALLSGCLVGAAPDEEACAEIVASTDQALLIDRGRDIKTIDAWQPPNGPQPEPYRVDPAPWRALGRRPPCDAASIESTTEPDDGLAPKAVLPAESREARAPRDDGMDLEAPGAHDEQEDVE